MKDTDEDRGDAHRRAEEHLPYIAVLWLITTAYTVFFMGWWALLPGAPALRSVVLYALSLARKRRLRED